MFLLGQYKGGKGQGGGPTLIHGGAMYIQDTTELIRQYLRKAF